jgi:perosamine synthetase
MTRAPIAAGTQAASPAVQPVIPVYRPDLSGNERRYVLDCVDSSWISSIGVYIERFEAAVAAATGAAHAIAVTNGTVALHLALHCLGIGPGDEVIVPAFTYIASVNTIAQTGATPVFCDSRPSDWLIDVEDAARRITPRTKAILPVHLYGAACDMPALMDLARAHGLAVVEDCAEALGTTIGIQAGGTQAGATDAGRRHVGRFGDIGTFSFFGNKTVTTGEGGMVICDDDDLAARLRMTKGQGQSLTRRYWHEVLGFNYRMTNICAAIGLAQMERLEPILARKRAIAARYRHLLADAPVTFQVPMQTVAGSDWLVSLLLPPGADRERVMAGMAARGVDTRPVFHCAHHMPMYRGPMYRGPMYRGPTYDQRAGEAAGEAALPVAEDIAARGLSLPSYPTLTEAEIEQVVAALRASLRG